MDDKRTGLKETTNFLYTVILTIQLFIPVSSVHSDRDHNVISVNMDVMY